jgi:hypothetical protein
MLFVLFWQLARCLVWKDEDIQASYLNSELYANHMLSLVLKAKYTYVYNNKTINNVI